MPAPFYNAVKGTTAGAPGTGAFTPNAASSGFQAWSIVPTGWIGLVRYEDGSTWELCYSYWNGTTLSRASTQIPHTSSGSLQTSSGSQLTLTSSATAALIPDANEVMGHVGGVPWGVWKASPATATASVIGLSTPTATSGGVAAAAGAIAATNLLTQQTRVVLTSVTTANGQAGWTNIPAGAGVIYSTTAGIGGFEMVTRFGASTLPTGPRLFVGVTGTTFLASTAEPGAFTANFAAFAKDSTDTNIQLLTNSNAGGGTKSDTGIALTANGWYETSVWAEPGGGRVYGLIIRLDNGAIWTGSTAADLPTSGTVLAPQVLGGLSATTGTSFVMNIGSMALRTSS
jgi:hypothetical protein